MEVFKNSATSSGEKKLGRPSSAQEKLQKIEGLQKSKSELSHDANLKALGVTQADERSLDPILFLVGMAG